MATIGRSMWAVTECSSGVSGCGVHGVAARMNCVHRLAQHGGRSAFGAAHTSQ